MEHVPTAQHGTAQRRRKRTPRQAQSALQPPVANEPGSLFDSNPIRQRPGPSTFSLLFADSERECKARFWKMSRTMGLSTTATMLLLVARLIQFGPVAFSSGPRDFGWIAAVARIAAFAVALAFLAPLWGFGISPSRHSAAASPAAVRRSEIGTYCIMAGEGLGAAVYAASTGAPPPGTIAAFAYGAIASGLPWYSHSLFAVVTFGTYLFAQGHTGQELASVDVIVDTLQNIIFGGLCSYMADRHLRAEYQTHERLREFRSTLNVAVEELSRSPSAPESLQGMAAREKRASESHGGSGRSTPKSMVRCPPSQCCSLADPVAGMFATIGRTVKQTVLFGILPEEQLISETHTDLVDNINASLARALAVCNLYVICVVVAMVDFMAIVRLFGLLKRMFLAVLRQVLAIRV